jgi:hypothetical protein
LVPTVVAGAVVVVACTGQQPQTAPSSTGTAKPSAEPTTSSDSPSSGSPGSASPTASTDQSGAGTIGLRPATRRCLQGFVLGGPGPDRFQANDTAAQVDAIAPRVAELRKLSFEQPVEPAFRDEKRFSQQITELTRSNTPAEETELDKRALAALGAIPRTYDLRGKLLELLGEQVIGYYDPESNDLLVKAANPQSATLSPFEQVTLAHELEHALVDQALGLPDVESLLDERGSDAASAATALIEGDAQLVTQRFPRVALTPSEIAQLAGDSASAATGADLSQAPTFLRRQLTFPYKSGLGFACSIYSEGGWQALNDAYEQPPRTTAAILFPDRYGQQPSEPPPLGAPGQGWQHARDDTFGAAPLMWLFAAPGGDEAKALDNRRERVAGWDGGQSTIWTRGDETAVGLTFAQRPDERRLCDSVTAWYEAAFPEPEAADVQDAELARDGQRQDAVVRCGDAGVRLGIGPDLATARAVAG